MVKGIILCFLLLSAGSVQAQDLDISLFDDDTPVLGRNAPPLDSLRLTPPPAPDIRIDLDNSQEQALQSTSTPSQPMPALPSTHIDLSGTTPTTLVSTPTPVSTPQIPLHDVSAFDIADFNLGISAKEAFQKARQKGFKVSITQESVPLFYSTDYAYKCRHSGLVIPEQVTKCIQDMACHENTRYISEATLTRKNETMHLYFTSNATDNLLYKILYINKGDNSLNFTRINKAKKEVRKNEFWAALFDKYGYPDDGERYIWGNPAKAYLTARMSGSAYDGYILMEDVQLSNDDYFAAEDVQMERPPYNTFAF